MKSSVFDAAGQIVHSLAFDNVREHHFNRCITSITTNPQEIAHTQATHFIRNLVLFKRLKGDVQRPFRFPVEKYGVNIIYFLTIPSQRTYPAVSCVSTRSTVSNEPAGTTTFDGINATASIFSDSLAPLLPLTNRSNSSSMLSYFR